MSKYFSMTGGFVGWKTAALVVLGVMLFVFVFCPSSASAAERSYGDINGDGALNVEDVVLVMRHILNLESLSSDQLELADVNGNGAVNIQDATLIVQKVLALVEQFPVDGLETDAFFVVEPNHNSIYGQSWTAATNLEINLGDSSFNVTTDTDGVFEMHEWEYQGLVIEAGQAVVVSGGGVTKVHFVRNLRVTATDWENDIISGEAAPGSIVEVRIFDPELNYYDFPTRIVEADTDGLWAADFSVAVGDELSDGIFDLELDLVGEARIADLENDSTMVFWQVTEAAFQVHPEDGIIRGFGWMVNSEIEVTVGDDNYIATTDSHSYFELDADVEAGDMVTVTDGINEKEHEVTVLQITSANRDTGLISGTAEAGSTVFIELLEPMVGQPGPPTLIAEAEIEADEDGEWEHDFDQAIGDNIEISVMQVDADGDSTVIVY